ncbi:MAG: hypothetical protein M2R45_05288 [Verrucomicrobia subdivision 3 bacterium]|nr:hypothetical protein [Limisphaerales bacterium]
MRLRASLAAPTKMKLSKRYLFLAIPVIAFTVFFILPKSRSLFQSKETREAIAKYEAHREETLATWQNANYVTIEHSGAFESKVRETVRQHEAAASLTTTQRRALATAIIELIYAHHDGAWESYRDFRIPIDPKHVRFDESRLNQDVVHLPSSHAEFLKLYKKGVYTNDFFDVKSPIGVLETYWRHIVTRTIFLDSGKPANCTRCWEDISLKEIYLSVHNIKEVPLSIMSYAGPNASSIYGIANSHPRLTFFPSIDGLLKTKKSVKIVFVSFLVRGEQIKNHPIYVSYYWSPQHRKWLPREFVAGVQGDVISYFF